MTDTVLITIKGVDKVGVVAAATGRLFDLGGNLGDASFAVLGGGFEFSCLCELPPDVSAADAEKALAGDPVLADCEIEVAELSLGAEAGESALVTHRVEVSGRDRPGLIARLSEVFTQYDTNLVRMTSSRLRHSGAVTDATYVTRFEICVPPKRAAACLAAVGNTAGQLNLRCDIQETG